MCGFNEGDLLRVVGNGNEGITEGSLVIAMEIDCDDLDAYVVLVPGTGQCDYDTIRVEGDYHGVWIDWEFLELIEKM
jgi:hypothetical protein